MLTFVSLPQVRVVRNAGQLVAPPPVPRARRAPRGEALREGLAIAVGLWPLTGVMLLALGLLVMAGNWSSP